jgi:hypothetical protein
MQLFMVDQIVLDIVSQKSHAGKLATVWITSLDFMLDSLEKKGKNAEQLDTCFAQSKSRMFADVIPHTEFRGK